MRIQRLRNLTTGILHTEMGHIHQDLEFLSGMEGLMTHMLPNARMALEPWLREKVTEEIFWDGRYDSTLIGEYLLEPMSEQEQEKLKERYLALPRLFSPEYSKKYGK